MARTKEQNSQMVLKTKKTIIEVALKEFALKGFAYASIRDIAKAAGMSTGIIYRYFESKECLFTDVVKKAVNSLTHSIKEIENTNLDPYTTLHHITEKVLVDINTSKETALYFLLMSRSLIEGESISVINIFRRQDLLLFEKTAALIEQGQMIGEFKNGDPYQLSLYYYSCLQGIANMSFFLKEDYLSPKAHDILAFLMKCPEKEGGNKCGFSKTYE